MVYILFLDIDGYLMRQVIEIRKKKTEVVHNFLISKSQFFKSQSYVKRVASQT